MRCRSGNAPETGGVEVYFPDFLHFCGELFGQPREAAVPVGPPPLRPRRVTGYFFFAGSGSTFAEAKQKAANGEFVSRALNRQASISVKLRRGEATSSNVAGVLEGSDPKLKDEYVVFSAHYDHLQSEANGEVYNGADDDGSGTVSVLEIAQAFAVGPRPPRSVLIIFHTGEELGLFGSEFNADYEPVVPLKKLVVDFNIDMVGRSRPAARVVGVFSRSLLKMRSAGLCATGAMLAVH